MKKRIVGLVALILCMMIASMPVAMADFFVYDSYGDPYAIMEGDVVFGGTQITAEISGGGSSWLSYALSPNPDDETTVEFAPGELVTVAPGAWYVTFVDYDGTLYLESAGNLIWSAPFGDDDQTHILAFDTLATSYLTTDVEAEFKAWLENEEPEIPADAKLLMMDANVYYHVTNGGVTSGVWLPCMDLPYGVDNFYLPNVNGEPLMVLHWSSDNYVEKLQCQATPAGLLVEGINACSPFAIVYIPDQTVPAAPSLPPESGDNSPLALLSVLAGVSLAGIVCLTIRRRKAA